MSSHTVTVVTKHSIDASGAERLHLLGIEVVRDAVTGLIHKADQLVAVSTESGAEIPCDAAASLFRAAYRSAEVVLRMA